MSLTVSEGVALPVPSTRQENDFAALVRYQRAANYLAAAQIYLQSNVLLKDPLTREQVKDRLLGHC